VRDILITLLVFGSLPFILRNPFFGVMVWTWLGFMNPHRLAWGFSTNLPFALIVFVTTVMAYAAASRESRRIPVTAETVTLLLLQLWMFVTTVNSMFPGLAWAQWDKVWRIQLGVVLTLIALTSKQRVILLVWTIAVSLGFYGLKGGIWTVLTGGANRVYGPPGTFIGGNNEIGLALIMTLPLLWFLVVQTPSKWMKMGLYFALGCTVIAIVGTHSRGALVGVAIMGVMFLAKSRQRLVPLLTAAAFALLIPMIMPQSWFDRMHTIETYESDKSAQGRFFAWRNASRLANTQVFGGGFESIAAVGGTDAHSIYFEMLGEHGYIGLGIFLLLGLLVWRKSWLIRRLSRPHPKLRWAADLAAMLQVSLVGYAGAGAFLGMAYFDFLYVIVAIVVALHGLVRRESEALQCAALTAGRQPGTDAGLSSVQSAAGGPLPSRAGAPRVSAAHIALPAAGGSRRT
jgi:probable O-glycosylation ligase (exosortase A-associated)